ncbi:uronate isomerase [Lactococcus hodotermopsidis]|uniref:Uronate isomerase n=1 Tax=Pseudolactococcus hodotermopsidis TaxID=2709157 RepID=A0A6A0BAU5_9LACT|nr:glucuronate isomerase [Lactococcus hodotermopsidis]GFH41936.1 uronate isomerase [Lactococcus hodotermopsidis]
MFLDKDFVLKNDFAKELYHDYAAKQPIIDYHCHLEPKEIYDDIKFENITQAWLYGDHYKWRLMRANGVPEKLITGNGSDYDKFLAFAESCENAIGNSVYVWTNLELKRLFDIDDVLTAENAPMIWEKVNQKITDGTMSARQLIKNAHVKVICTTDDPASTLDYHQKLAAEEQAFKVYPTFRPDKAFAIGTSAFAGNIKELSEVSGITVKSFADLIQVLEERIDFFHSVGGRLSDHGFNPFPVKQAPIEVVEGIFTKALNGETLTADEIEFYSSELMFNLMKLYQAKDWAVQLHLQATRSNSTKLFNEVGVDVGGDAIADGFIEAAVQSLFDRVELACGLPKTILYSLNPKDHISLIALMGAFQGGQKGKIQYGSGWWFNDNYSGMRKQIVDLAEGGVLGNFVGMLTDSRSFLSYPRHEYFRRILCQVISEWMEDGQLPADSKLIGPIVANIAYGNAATYFGFDLPKEV